MKSICFSDFDFYIIHMKSLVHRYEHLKQQFKNINIDIEKNEKIHFIEGIVPEFKGNYKEIGAHGIAIGHFNAIRTSLQYYNPYSLILEDDAMFLDNFVNNFNLTFHNLHKNKEEYDIVQFRSPKVPCNNTNCKIIDNYITGKCRFVTAECIYLTRQIREKIINNPGWFFRGAPIDCWYTNNLKCIKTVENYTWQQRSLGSFKKSLRSKKGSIPMLLPPAFPKKKKQ